MDPSASLDRSDTAVRRVLFGAVVALAFGQIMFAARAELAAAAPIQSPGPLTTIAISPDLSCAVSHAGDVFGEWFGDTACATLVSAGGVLYGPAAIPAGFAATGTPGFTAFTVSSQTGPTGSGSVADPFVVTTVVDLGSSGLRLTEVDSYVVGQESYRTDVTLTSSGGQLTPVTVYRGGDCYLQDSDYGFGEVHNGTAPICKALPQSVDPQRIEGFYPLTPDSRYIEAGYNEVWSVIGAQQPLPNTCRCQEEIDNGVALSWSGLILPGAAWTTSSLTLFSPAGAAAITLGKSADVASVGPGVANGYTVTLANPGVIPQTLSQIVDTLPTGFTYIPGTTTGAATGDPSVSGSTLTWAGSFFVPAAARGVPGTLRLHFGVTVSATAGTYTNSVTAFGQGVSVVAATDVAPITVIVAGVNLPPAGAAGGPYSGTVSSPIAIAGAASDPDLDPLNTRWAIDAAAPGACTFADPSTLTTTVGCDTVGLYPLTLTIADGHNPPVSVSTTLAVSSGVTTTSPPIEKPTTVPTTTIPATTTTAAAARLTIVPAMVDFGSGPIGATLPQAVLTVTNSGGSSVEISGVALVGTGAADFAVVGDGCAGQALPPAGTCALTVASTPQRGGPSAATLQVTGNRGTSAAATLQVVGTFTPTLRVKPGVLRNRDAGTAIGAGFPPNTPIQLAYHGEAPFASATTDASGALLVTIAVLPGEGRIGGQVLTAVDQPGVFTNVRSTFVVQTPTMQPLSPASPAIANGVRALGSRNR